MYTDQYKYNTDYILIPYAPEEAYRIKRLL